ncbi:MAG: hypothetical protein K8R21_13445 [Leptospira sp.]|nr:hypothetical protein [Leptospira sp.]
MLNLPFYLSSLFGLISAILIVYGIATNGSEIYTRHSLGYNINIIWGSVIFCASMFFLALGKYSARKKI